MLVRLSMRLQCRAICVNERFISVGRGVNGRRGILAARNPIPLAAARWLREPQAHIALYLLPGARVAVMRHSIAKLPPPTRNPKTAAACSQLSMPLFVQKENSRCR